MNIRKTEIEKMISQIRKDENNSFSTFLVIELRNRFEKRVPEEKHLDFNEWMKIYMLRDKSKEERMEKKWKALLKQEEENRMRRRGTKIRKNKEKYKDIEIPDFIKHMGTKQLLSLRFSDTGEFLYSDGSCLC